MDSNDEGIYRETMKPKFVMMVGTYAAGKSTWSQNALDRLGYNGDWEKISGEEVIAEIAKKHRLSSIQEVYQDKQIYDDYIDSVFESLNLALKNGKSILFDSTNTAASFRKQLLNKVTDADQDYFIAAVCMLLEPEEASERLEKRNTANAHDPYLQAPSLDLQRSNLCHFDKEGLPTLDEGFDIIVSVPTEAYRQRSYVETVTGRRRSQGTDAIEK